VSVTLVYCGQTVGWIKMKLGTQVGLRPGHIVLDGDPATPSPKGAQPPIFGQYLFWPNGWMDQHATWQADRPWPKRHCVRWRPSSPSPKGGRAPNFRPVYCGQTAGCIKMPLDMEVGLGPGHIVLDGEPVPPKEGGTARAPFFGPCLWPNGRLSQLLLRS